MTIIRSASYDQYTDIKDDAVRAVLQQLSENSENLQYQIEQIKEKIVEATDLADLQSEVSTLFDGSSTTNATGGTLNPATTSTLGGVIVGSNLSVQSDGTLSADAQPISPATTSALGGIMVGSNLTITGTGVLSANYGNATASSAGLMSSTDYTKLGGIATNANNYSLPNAVTTSIWGSGGSKGGVRPHWNHFAMSSDLLTIKDNGVNSNQLANYCVTLPKMSSYCVDYTKIGDNEIYLNHFTQSTINSILSWQFHMYSNQSITVHQPESNVDNITYHLASPSSGGRPIFTYGGVSGNYNAVSRMYSAYSTSSGGYYYTYISYYTYTSSGTLSHVSSFKIADSRYSSFLST